MIISGVIDAYIVTVQFSRSVVSDSLQPHGLPVGKGPSVWGGERFTEGAAGSKSARAVWGLAVKCLECQSKQLGS